VHEHGHEHEHEHEHDYDDVYVDDHDQDHVDVDVDERELFHGHARTISLEEAILAKNDALAARNRELFQIRGMAVFNFTSAPGAGKTSLLETLIREVGGRVRLAVIEGDQETEQDAARIRATGASVVQINTGTGCHLDAAMVADAIDELDPPRGSLLLIENVGNLVCPALFDLGERAKVVLMSVTEGEDKPLKYPHMFRAAQALVLTKIDLVPYLEFDVARCLANARLINPQLRVFQLSAKSGAGMPAFCDWVASQAAPVRA
jgi:hydrogenase nickel incorporation protein HypB